LDVLTAVIMKITVFWHVTQQVPPRKYRLGSV
jgi:hypothetical protein